MDELGGVACIEKASAHGFASWERKHPGREVLVLTAVQAEVEPGLVAWP
jgi:hypothetical protein